MHSKKTIQKLLANRNWPAIEKILQKKPEDQYDDLDLMAFAFYQFYFKKNVQLGICSLEKACLLAPKNISYLNALSDFYLKTQAFELANQAVQKSLNLQPDHPMSLLARANIAIAQRDYGQAFSCLIKSEKSLNQNDVRSFKTISNLKRLSNPRWLEPLIGKNLNLVRISGKHKAFLLKARNNQGFQHHYNLFKPTSESQLDFDISQANKSPIELKKIEWIVEKSGIPMGVAGLVDIDFRNKRAEIQVGFPNEKSFSNALEATLLILEYGFMQMGLNKIISYVYSDNPFGQKNTLHLGFHQEGNLKRHVYDKQSAKWLDLFVNALLRDEYLLDQHLKKLHKKLLKRDVNMVKNSILA